MRPRNRPLSSVAIAAAAWSVAGCTSSLETSEFWVSEPPAITSAVYSRAGITVADMDESLKLYRDVFGMRVLVDRLGKTDARLSAFSGLTDDQSIRLVVLRTETEGIAQLNAGYIGLAEITNSDGTATSTKTPLVSSGAETGSIMLMFVVEDIQETWAAVREMGYDIISEPEQRDDGTWSELLMRGPNAERLWVTGRYGRSVLVEKTVP